MGAIGEFFKGLRVTGKVMVDTVAGDGLVTTQYPKEFREEAATFPWPACTQSLPRWYGEMHRLRALRRGVPGPLHLRPGDRQPARSSGQPGRAVRIRL